MLSVPSRAQIASFLLVLSVSSPTLEAQSLVGPGVELPPMMMNLCPSRDDAKEQAVLSAAFGRLVADDTELRDRSTSFLAKGCSSLPVTTRLRWRDGTISAVETWTVIFDPHSAKTFEAERHNGVVHPIPYRIGKQLVRYYFGSNWRPPRSPVIDRLASPDIEAGAARGTLPGHDLRRAPRLPRSVSDGELRTVVAIAAGSPRTSSRS